MIIAQPRWHKGLIGALDRATTDGVTKPSYNSLIKVNGLIARHVRDGLWAGISTYYNFRHDGAEGFNYYNLKTPTSYKITKSGTTTFTSNTKVVFNGSSGYYNTNWLIGSDGYSLNAHSIGAGITDFPVAASLYMFGLNAAGVRYTMLSSDGQGWRDNCGSTDGDTLNTTPVGAAKLILSRINSTNVSFNRNGVNDGTKAQPNDPSSFPAAFMYLGCRSASSSPNGIAGAGLSYWWAGALVSDADGLKMYNNEVAFETISLP